MREGPEGEVRARRGEVRARRGEGGARRGEGGARRGSTHQCIVYKDLHTKSSFGIVSTKRDLTHVFSRFSTFLMVFLKSEMSPT